MYKIVEFKVEGQKKRLFGFQQYVFLKDCGEYHAAHNFAGTIGDDPHWWGYRGHGMMKAAEALKFMEKFQWFLDGRPQDSTVQIEVITLEDLARIAEEERRFYDPLIALWHKVW